MYVCIYNIIWASIVFGGDIIIMFSPQDEDFQLADIPPLTTTLQSGDIMIPVSITLQDDVTEEGYENFTLSLTYNMPDPDNTVDVVTPTANVFIKDDDGELSQKFLNRFILFPSVYSTVIHVDIFILEGGGEGVFFFIICVGDARPFLSHGDKRACITCATVHHVAILTGHSHSCVNLFSFNKVKKTFII